MPKIQLQKNSLCCVSPPTCLRNLPRSTCPLFTAVSVVPPAGLASRISAGATIAPNCSPFTPASSKRRTATSACFSRTLRKQKKQTVKVRNVLSAAHAGPSTPTNRRMAPAASVIAPTSSRYSFRTTLPRTAPSAKPAIACCWLVRVPPA